jgi:hypothetical protein
MSCKENREWMPEVAAGFSSPNADENRHLASCQACTEELKAMRATMAVLDDWKTPEPSPYFDVRLQARLREEIAKPQAGWLQWFRRPVLAAALTVLMGVGVGWFFTHNSGVFNQGNPGVISDNFVPEPGTAVSDLQALEKNHDLYSDFELLDDLTVQKDVVANQ